MTNLPLQCPLCGNMMEIDASMAGMQVACPTCQGIVQTPPLDDGTVAPPVMGEPMSLGCPICQGAFQVVPEMAGQQVACPHCQSPVGIPDLWNVDAPPIAPDAMAPMEAPPVMEADADNMPVVRSGKKKKRIESSIANLLPPGAENLPPEMPVPAPSAAPVADDPAMLAAALLPPGAATAGKTVIGEQKAISTTPAKRPVKLPTPAHGVVVPTPDGGYATLQDKPAMVQTAVGPMEVRKLSPEEKARRRLRMNVIMFLICMVILIVAGYVFTML